MNKKNKKELTKEVKNEENKIEELSEIQVPNNNDKNSKKKFTIFGFTITRLLAYFVIYSIVGFIIETIFGLVTKGVLESRKSFLYGPFCGIYGVGAVIMIVALQKFKKNNYTLFLGGFIVGSIVEYVISWIGEMIFHIIWWDYSTMPFNLNGRICLWFSLFWGILGIYLMSHLQPKMDHFLDKFSPKILKTVTIILVIFMFLNCLVTGFALKMFFTRLVNEHDLQLRDVDEYLAEYTSLYEQPEMKNIVDTFFNNEVMLKTFPNIKVTNKEGNIIWVKDILSDIQPYYVRVFTPKLP